MSLNVSSRSYYDWRLNKYIIRINKRSKLKEDIQASFDNSVQIYGSVRIAADLCAKGTKTSRATVQKYMKELGIKSIRTPKSRVCTTDSNHNNSIADNLLDRNFSVNEPNKVWVSDITYIKTKSGFDYLTTIIDLFDRKVVGWSQSSNMTTEDTMIAAFNSAIKRRNLSVTSAHGLMLHSDRGFSIHLQ